MRVFGGDRLCFFRASLTTPRWPLAVNGSEGCESQLKHEEKENEDVVGRTKGKGILGEADLWREPLPVVNEAQKFRQHRELRRGKGSPVGVVGMQSLGLSGLMRVAPFLGEQLALCALRRSLSAA